ncbi:hypothetical protein ACTPEF_26950, partial [Clostridioides difficile]
KRGIITLENVSLQDVQSKLEEHCNKDSVKNVTRKEIENIKGTVVIAGTIVISQLQALRDSSTLFLTPKSITTTLAPVPFIFSI